jgi:general nucleoside transport system permease protein
MSLTGESRFALGGERLHVVGRSVGPFVFGLALFAVVLLAFGKNPLRAYVDILGSTLGSWYGLSETLVKMIPLVLAAVAVALPAKIWLINVGGEGQLYIGALFATWGALTLDHWPAVLLLPAMAALGFLGGGAWAALSGILRARGLVSETISTLLLNYVAILLVHFAVFGPWKDPEGVNYPQTAEFPSAATLPTLGGSRVHLGLALAAMAVLLFGFVVARTRWGLEMRAIGGNPEAARRAGIPIGWYIVVLMFVGGGLAGLAGMSEVSAVQGRLRPSLSPGYGYTGFLISWMAGGRPGAIVAAAFLIAVISAGGDILQMTQSLPASAVNILMAVILFVVLGQRGTAR